MACGSRGAASAGGVRGAHVSPGVVRGWVGGTHDPAGTTDRWTGGVGESAGAVSTVAKGHSRSAKGTTRAGEHGRGLCAARGGSTPRRVPDFNRPPPLADGLAGNFPRPREPQVPFADLPVTGRSPSSASPVSPTPVTPPGLTRHRAKPHQSLRDDELDMNFRTM
ncbi:hypothetical protein GCM10011579_037960 [Streptomyces albiflavescens]|uniref:Uncharacterized protein n=1 Tax=Streptomyces albiflavescens TaxID=1623582 RepID=A0A918D551_9ACTN|nr:hypothetical protein GCM10011579_037960 [Streptomyces albiflavescens]